MFGSEKQIEWAYDIKKRMRDFSTQIATIRAKTNDEKIIKLIDKIERRCEYIQEEKDAGFVIRLYGYAGLEYNSNGKYKKSLSKFVIDMLDISELVYVESIMSFID